MFAFVFKRFVYSRIDDHTKTFFRRPPESCLLLSMLYISFFLCLSVCLFHLITVTTNPFNPKLCTSLLEGKGRQPCNLVLRGCIIRDLSHKLFSQLSLIIFIKQQTFLKMCSSLVSHSMSCFFVIYVPIYIYRFTLTRRIPPFFEQNFGCVI